MAQLFVSYKSEDRPRVKPLVEALEADGLSVWWDAHIEGGAGWRQRIQTELEAAKCVLVAWSKRSVGPEGEFVHDEATRAKRRGAYLPVLLDAVDLPLGFGEKQALALTGWKGNREDARYQAVLAAARAVVSGGPRVELASLAAGAPALGRRAVIGGAVVLGAAALGGVGWYLLRPGEAPTSAESIAVLPFKNLSGDPAQAYFSDGIAEELRSALARIAGLTVAARTSSELVRDSDLKEAAAKLGVAHVLTGSVRKGGGTIRVTAQLLNGATGLEEWSERYDRPEGDALVVQTGIAESVANALSLSLGRAAVMLGGTKNPVAYDAYLRGLSMSGTSLEIARARLAAFDAALAADPDFAAAHANRASSLSILAGLGGAADLTGALDDAEASARRAIALEPKLPMAHVAMGITQSAKLNLRAADAAYSRALSLPGVGARELSLIGEFPILMGRTEEGMALLDRAVALDPLSPVRQRLRIYGLVYGRKFDEALAAIQTYDAANPDNSFPQSFRVLALLGSGNAREALAVAGELSEDWQRFYYQAIAAARLGDRAASDKALAALKAVEGDGTLAFQFASIHATRGEAELALAQLERAVEQRDPGLVDLRVFPEFDALRQHPRYAAVEKRLGFPPARAVR